MIAGVIKGMIEGKSDYRGNEDSDYCGLLVVNVQTWADGQNHEQKIAVYVPKFMHRKMDFFMRESTKFVTVAFDHMSVIPSAKSPGTFVIAVKANQLSA